MTPEAQRIAIAEACGYKPYPWFTGEFLMKQGNLGPPFWSKDGKDAYVPDYLNDLNAMHEAEIYASEHLMDADQWEEYGKALQRVHPRACLFTHGSHGDIDFGDFATLMTLTATQRAEAFLRTIGKWQEAKPVSATN